MENHHSRIKCRAVAPDRPKFKNWLHYIRAGVKHYSPSRGVCFNSNFSCRVRERIRQKPINGKLLAQCLVHSWCLISGSYDADFIGPFQEKILMVEAASSKPSPAPSLMYAVTVSLLPQLFMPRACQHFISDSRAAFTLAELKTFLDRNSG